jgi:hypothetical protein
LLHGSRRRVCRRICVGLSHRQGALRRSVQALLHQYCVTTWWTPGSSLCSLECYPPVTAFAANSASGPACGSSRPARRLHSTATTPCLNRSALGLPRPGRPTARRNPRRGLGRQNDGLVEHSPLPLDGPAVGVHVQSHNCRMDNATLEAHRTGAHIGVYLDWQLI